MLAMQLVYTYVLRYAEEKSDIALLSINTFQKDMEHTNQLIRALALRVMSGIRVPVCTLLPLFLAATAFRITWLTGVYQIFKPHQSEISWCRQVINQLVLLAIKKAASDPSPYVRKTAAYAIPKLYRMDPVLHLRRC